MEELVKQLRDQGLSVVVAERSVAVRTKGVVGCVAFLDEADEVVVTEFGDSFVTVQKPKRRAAFRKQKPVTVPMDELLEDLDSLL